MKPTNKGYIYEQVNPLFGKPKITGFGFDKLNVQIINRVTANNIIKKNHYSGKCAISSYVHLGVYSNNELLGVLQFGYAMNPSSGNSIIPGTNNNQYLELNRMWLDDKLPRNSESQAVSFAIKYIKKIYPQVGWIQYVAD